MCPIEIVNKTIVSVSPAGTMIELAEYMYRSQARVSNTITGKRIKSYRFDTRFNKEISSRYLTYRREVPL